MIDNTSNDDEMKKIIQKLKEIDHILRINSNHAEITNNLISDDITLYDQMINHINGTSNLVNHATEMNLLREELYYLIIFKLSYSFKLLTGTFNNQNANKKILDWFSTNVIKDDEKYTEILNEMKLNQFANKISIFGSYLKNDAAEIVSIDKEITALNKIINTPMNVDRLFDNFYSNLGSSNVVYNIILLTTKKNIVDKMKLCDEYNNSIYEFGKAIEKMCDVSISDQRNNIDQGNINESIKNIANNFIDQNIIANFPKNFLSKLEVINKINLLREFFRDVIKQYITANNYQDCKQYIVGYIYQQFYQLFINYAVVDVIDKLLSQLANIKIMQLYKDIFNTLISFVRTFIIPLYKTFPNSNAVIKNYISAQLNQLSSYQQYLANRLNKNASTTKYILYQKKKLLTDDNLSDNFTKASKNLEYFTSKIQTDLTIILNDEKDILVKIIKLDTTIGSNFNQNEKILIDRQNKIKELIISLDEVIFSSEYINMPFVDSGQLLDRLSEITGSFRLVEKMISTKTENIYNLKNQNTLMLSQRNNYILFLSNNGKDIRGEELNTKNYKQMSFGLVEYYYSIIRNILTCIDSKTYENMSDVEQYLYLYHYITLNRCNKLFNWIINKYLVYAKKKQYDKKKVEGDKFKDVLILAKKISLTDVKDNIKNIFNEFNGIKDLLDQYKSIVMSKVSLHLRINDFRPHTENEIENKYKDWDPSDFRYDEDNLVFTNDGHKLLINFANIPGYTPNMDDEYQDKYNIIWNRMKGDNKGINFERIYNSKDYPSADIISNYMSLSANIMRKMGTMMMTYGYSGVGKTASLFGAKANPAIGVEKQSGILQATLDRFGSDMKIYLRTFEIYGLGTQYDFYWNPRHKDSSGEDDYKCFPDIYELVIHHDLEAKIGGRIINKGNVVLLNRADIFAYISNMSNPTSKPKLRYTDPNNRPVSLQKLLNGDDFKESTYIEINENHYRDFSNFVDNEIERNRKDVGLKVKQLFEHDIFRIKGTVNNTSSSRSILVYDFQIALGDPTNPIYVPFVIYDLPGKEDLMKTYINPKPNDFPVGDKKREFAYDDLSGDILIPNHEEIKPKKSSFVTNPLRIPFFCDDRQLDLIMNNLKSLDYRATDHYKRKIIDDIVNYNLTHYVVTQDMATKTASFVDSQPLQISDLYNIQINTFSELFDGNNLSNDYKNATGPTKLGLIETHIYQENLQKNIFIF